MSITTSTTSTPVDLPAAGTRTPADPTPATRVSTLRHALAFWVTAASFALVMAYSTVPTPLYGLYQSRDGFPTPLITVIFAAYAVGVMLTLWLAGHLSDWFGRRRLTVVALVVEIVSAVVFLLWPAVPGLLLGRLLSGLGVGALSATATAHLAELRAQARPRENPSRAALLATVANLGGLSLGPLVAGLLSDHVRRPLTVPYVLFAAAMTVAVVAMLLVPETVSPRRLEHYRPQQVRLPESMGAAARATFAAAGAGAFAAYAVTGLFTSLAPTLLARTFDERSRTLAGAVTFTVFVAGALSQVLLARAGGRRQTVLGYAGMVSGLVALVAGAALASLPAFLAGTLVAGAGVGLVFRRAIAAVSAVARPDQRGGLLAGTFLVAYAGLVAPVLLIGLALVFVSPTTALIGFSAAVLVLLAWSARRMLSAAR